MNSIKENKSSIAIDFDGVIHKYSKGYNTGEIYDVPVDGAKVAIEMLRRDFNIIVSTAREDVRPVLAWLTKHSIIVDEVTNKKPIAAIYIDDKGLRFENWFKAYFDIYKLLELTPS